MPLPLFPLGVRQKNPVKHQLETWATRQRENLGACDTFLGRMICQKEHGARKIMTTARFRGAGAVRVALS